MQETAGLGRYKLTENDARLLSILGFKIVANDVDLESIDLRVPEIAALKNKRSVYFWRLRHKGDEFKIYVGKTNSLPRRLKEYSNEFQPGVPNDSKLRHFQLWSRSKLPGSTLDLLVVQRDDNQEVETEVWRKTKPLINGRAGVSSQDLRGSHYAYYANIFETKLSPQGKQDMIGSPENNRVPKSVKVGKRPDRMSNHEMIASALKGHSGREIETKQFKEIILKAFPEFTEGSLLPNDHAKGNKSDCPCAGTERRLLDWLSPGLYRVR